jgi:TolB-like protein/Tfp pilus assembly protein PilF
MGDVYEAQDLRLPRSVAIKVLKPSLVGSRSAVKRFRRESWLSASLNHPNVCTILDVGEAAGVSFIAMELLQGESLKQRLRRGPLPLDELLRVATDVTKALVSAHAAGIVHRDLTPGNIFLTEHGGAKLLDFGLATMLAPEGEAASESVTETGLVIGTVFNLAPEQLKNEEVDRRADLFALGTVLYEGLSGTRPFEGHSKADVIQQILAQEPIPLRQLARHCPPALEQMVHKLLEKDPAQRYQRASDVLREIENLKQMERPSAATATATARHGSTALAVLPFSIIGESDDDLRAFRDGLPEDIAWWLQDVPGVRVAPRTSTERVRGQSIRSIGDTLGVSAVIEGTVQRAGGRLRVIANLIHAATEEPMRRSVRVEADAGDLLAAQDEVSAHIVAAVRSAAAQSALPDSSNPAAHFEYERGRHYRRDLFTGGWSKVIEHATRARELDRNFAAADVLLADTYNFLGMLSLMMPRVAFAKARTAAERALSLAPDAAAAHAELALSRFGGDWDWDAAEQGFRKAFDIDPDLASARVYYSWLLAVLGRDAAAIAEANQATASSQSRFVQAGSALTYVMCGRFDEALQQAERCVVRNPEYPYAILVRGQCYHLLKRYADAHRDLERVAELAGRAPHYLGLLGKSYGDAGLHDQARAIVAELEDLRQRTYVAPHCFVYVLYGLGERERALEFQEQAYQDGAPPINYFTPFIRELFSLDPRHRDRLRQMRLNV